MTHEQFKDFFAFLCWAGVSIAFGIWQDSIAAGLFMLFAVGIYSVVHNDWGGRK